MFRWYTNAFKYKLWKINHSGPGCSFYESRVVYFPVKHSCLYKPTDKHQYLLKSSCHPSHTKQSIPFSMALRLRRICSTDEFFNTRSDALTSHLIKRGYKYRFIKDEIDKVRQIPRCRALETSTKKESNRIPFVVTFNPALPNIRQVISSNLNILRSSQRCQAAFHSPPLISYRRCNNLRDILVRAKHRRPPPPPPPPGTGIFPL